MALGVPAYMAVDWNGTVVPWFGESPYEGALAALSDVRALQIPLIVVSHATPAQILADVKRIGLEAEQVHGVQGKTQVLAALQRDFGRGLMIGDSPQDGRAAREAGAVFIQAALEGESALPYARGRLEAWSELDLLLGAVAAEFAVA